MIQDKKIALLIDAENITSKYGAIIFREVAKYGTATYRRIYGDFVNSRNINWTQADFSKFSLTPVQQYSYTVGKNSSDITMVIDAMDILYSGNVDMFCIVTSDSDYTKLVTRLTDSKLIGFLVHTHFINRLMVFPIIQRNNIPIHFFNAFG